MLYHGRVDVLAVDFSASTVLCLSGSLITSLLAREWLTWGRIDMLGFWARRARRLLPAAWLVLLACAAYGVLFAPADRLAQLRSDAIATFFYVVNWHFITSGQSYFAQYGEPSPLRHMWSLAIEEQFYFLWPMALTLLLPMILRRRRIGVAVMVTAAVLSAVLMALLYDRGRTPHASTTGPIPAPRRCSSAPDWPSSWTSRALAGTGVRPTCRSAPSPCRSAGSPSPVRLRWWASWLPSA